MEILSSLRDTEETLKDDVDVSPNWPVWWRLKVVLSFLNNFPEAKLFQTGTGSYHLESQIASSMKIRRAIPDCRGRLYVSDRRFEMIGSHGDIIFWTGKGKFRYEMRNGELCVRWTRKRVKDREITLRDFLALPFKLSELDFHQKHRTRFFRRKAWKLSHTKKPKY